MKDIVLNKHAFHFENFLYTDGIVFDHSIPDKAYEFIILKNGFVELKTEKNSITALAGEMTFIPPNIHHNVCFSPGAQGIILRFMYWPDVEDFVYPIQKITIDQILRQHIEGLPEFSDNVDSRFIWKAYRFLDIVQDYMKKNDSKNTKKIQKAINFMRENDNYTIPQLAKMCNMSECRFYVVFGEIIGMTPIKMKHKIQTTKAELLLRTTTLSIDEIAHKVGFESTAHFRKVFNEHFNVSPKQIRKELN